MIASVTRRCPGSHEDKKSTRVRICSPRIFQSSAKMPKANRATGKTRHDPLYVQLKEDELHEKYGTVSQPGKRKKTRNSEVNEEEGGEETLSFPDFSHIRVIINIFITDMPEDLGNSSFRTIRPTRNASRRDALLFYLLPSVPQASWCPQMPALKQPKRNLPQARTPAPTQARPASQSASARSRSVA